jgi:hypothetical protein
VHKGDPQLNTMGTPSGNSGSTRNAQAGNSYGLCVTFFPVVTTGTVIKGPALIQLLVSISGKSCLASLNIEYVQSSAVYD